MIGGLLAMVVLLLLNGLFVAAEFAFIAARRSDLEQLAAAGDARAQAAVKSVHQLSLMLSAAQLGITISSLLLGAVAEPAVSHLLEGPLHAIGLSDGTSHAVAFTLALALVVFLHMVVGEMIPKNIAIAEPVRTALWLAMPMRAFGRVFQPVVVLLNTSANAGLRLVGVEPKDELSEAHTGDEIADMLAMSHRAGVLEDVGHRLMTGALRFPAREVSTVMVPRDQVVAVAAGTPPESLEHVVLASGHSRIVVYGRDLDDVLGYVHAKDLLVVGPEARRRPLPPRLIRRMLVLGASQTLQQVLLAMRRARVHAGLVVDGQHTVGLITLEDVLEALVGDIRDEHDASHGTGLGTGHGTGRGPAGG